MVDRTRLNRLGLLVVSVFLLTGFAATVVLGRGFELSRHAVAGGGITSMTADGFALDATAGQADAGTMSGHGWEMVGGFWAVAPAVCYLPADMNGDGVVDALDIQYFVACLTGVGDACDCAQLDGHTGLGAQDMAAFVEQLLYGTE